MSVVSSNTIFVIFSTWNSRSSIFVRFATLDLLPQQDRSTVSVDVPAAPDDMALVLHGLRSDLLDRGQGECGSEPIKSPPRLRRAGADDLELVPAESERPCAPTLIDEPESSRHPFSKWLDEDADGVYRQEHRADDGCAPDDIDQIRKANPGAAHGVGASLEWLQASAARAVKRGGSALTSYMRVPWAPVEPKAKPKAISKRRKDAILDGIVAIMRLCQPTPFVAESACRHGIRSSLCLQGWSWPEADAAAVEIVASALRIVGAKRPTWEQGQPEYAFRGDPGVRENCIRCGKPLPEFARKFCGPACRNAHHAHWADLTKRDERNATRRARMAAWTAKQPARTCEGCKVAFKPRTPGQRFCSGQCVGLTYGPINGGRR